MDYWIVPCDMILVCAKLGQELVVVETEQSETGNKVEQVSRGRESLEKIGRHW